MVFAKGVFARNTTAFKNILLILPTWETWTNIFKLLYIARIWLQSKPYGYKNPGVLKSNLCHLYYTKL